MKVESLVLDITEINRSYNYKVAYHRGKTVCGKKALVVLDNPLKRWGRISCYIGKAMQFSVPLDDLCAFADRTGQNEIVDFCNWHLSQMEE